MGMSPWNWMFSLASTLVEPDGHVRILQFQGIMGFKSFLPRNHRFLGRKPKVSRQETYCIKAPDGKKTHAVRME
jgi:hypothetical protein